MSANTIPVTVGRLVLYRLSKEDAEMINRRRVEKPWEKDNWPAGAQAHVGNPAQEGDTFPMIVVKVWEGNMVNGQVFLDGNDTFWTTSVEQGEGVGKWDWMPFQKDQQARLAKQEEEDDCGAEEKGE